MVIRFCEEEDFDDAHDKMMDEFRDEMLAFRRKSREVYEAAVRTGLDGVMDATEEVELQQQADELRAANKSLAQKFVSSRKTVCSELKLSMMSQELLGEHFFAMALSSYGKKAQDFVDNILKTKMVVQKGVKTFESPFDTAVLLDKQHINFTVRNFLGIMFAFYVGYFGYSKIILPKSGGIAGTISLLLSKFGGGSAIQHNMQRFQGLVLGTMIGQLIWVFFGWDSTYGYTMLSISFLLYEFVAIYINKSAGPDFAYIGGLIAWNGANQMLMGYSDETYDPTPKYYTIVNVVLSITIMIIFDLLLSTDRASSGAMDNLFQASDALRDIVFSVFEVRQKKYLVEEAFTKHKDFMSLAAECEEAALAEARYWRDDFNADIWDQAMKCHETVIEAMKKIVFTLTSDESGEYGGTKSTLFMQLLDRQEMVNVRDVLLEQYDCTFGVVCTVFTKELPESIFEADVAPFQERRHLSKEMLKALCMACEDVGTQHAGSSQQETPKYLYRYPLCQLAMALCMVNTVSAELCSLERCVLRNAPIVKEASSPKSLM